MIKLNHAFKNRCDIHDLFKNDCCLINTFCNNLESQAREKATQSGFITESSERQKFIDKFKGDGLEILVEFLLRDDSHIHNICIQDYQIIPSDDDTGVDGRGISTINKNTMTVQVKYRQSNYVLKGNADHLSNFLNASVFKYDVKPEDTHNMIIITTADGTHHYSEKDMLHGKVRTYGRDDLRKWVDNKIGWWDEFKKSLIHSRTQTEETKRISLRPHQQEAVDAILAAIDGGENNGKVILPTGTGKTLVEAAAIAERIKLGDRVFVVFSPRIILSFQLLKSISAYLRGEGINAEYLNVNSGNFPEEEINEAQIKMGFQANPIKSTTSPEVIVSEANRAFNLNSPLIISSTYHSAEQLQKSGITIDLQLNDEAHWLVSEEFNRFANVGVKSFSFTATPKITDDEENGRGMQNVIRFGNEVFKKTPKEMIEAGEMLPPALHYVSTDNQSHTNNYSDLFDCVTKTFDRHMIQLQRKSRCPDQIGAKLLVTLPGQSTLEGILRCPECQIYRNLNHDVNLIAMASDIGSYINGEQTSGSKKAFEKIRSMESTEKAIIFHVDMLSEGIDAPGITAFMPLRGMGDSKFIQSVGRACRLFDTDRRDLYDGVLKPSQRHAYVKPYAYVIIPDLTIGCEDYKERYNKIIYQILDEYGLDWENIVKDDRGDKPNDEEEDPNDLSARKKKNFSAADFIGLVHSIKEDIDRPIDIHELALIDLYNKYIGEEDDESI